MRRRIGWTAAALVLRAAIGSAQSANEPLPRFVADVQGVSAGLPSAAGWTPSLPPNTSVPTRGLGLQGSAHVLFGRLGAGATVLFARGETTPVSGTPAVKTSVRALAPHVSLNFGHRLGWSYVSTGYGGAQVNSESAPSGATQSASAHSGWVSALNFGGGARWFLREHFGVGFDLRWHRLSSREVEGGTAPSQTMFVLGVGVSVQ